MKDEHEQLLRIARASWGAIVGPATESEQGCFDQGFRAAVFALEALSHAAGQEVVEVGTLYITDRYVEFDIQREAHDLLRYHKLFGIGAHSVRVEHPAVARSEGED